MTIRKCTTCRYVTFPAMFCNVHGRPCKDVQDDAKFDPCGVTFAHPDWDLSKGSVQDKKELKQRYEQEEIRND